MYKPAPEFWAGEGQAYELLVRSPWMIIGDRRSVSMETKNSFVGDHTPRIALKGDGTPGGLLQDRRPPRKNPAWKGVEHNDVGIHEFMELTRLLGTEAFIAVNTGTGSSQAAAPSGSLPAPTSGRTMLQANRCRSIARARGRAASFSDRTDSQWDMRRLGPLYRARPRQCYMSIS